MEEIVEYKTCLGVIRYFRMGDGSLVPELLWQQRVAEKSALTEKQRETIVGNAEGRR